MIAAYVVNGVKSGLVAGLVFGLLVALVANPLVAFAEGGAHVEHVADAGDHEHAGHSHENGVLPASLTDGVSVLSGVLWGVFLGVVAFGIAFYFLEPIVPGSGSVRSYAFGATGFLTASVAPWLAFPPAPPGVERALDPNAASLLYVGLVAAGAIASVTGMYAYDRLREGCGRPIAAAAGALPWLLLVAVAVALVGVPSVAVPTGLPADLAHGLAGLVAFGQALTWLVMAGAHARFHSTADRNARSTDAAFAEETPAGSP